MQLLYMGREWPQGYEQFRNMTKKAFLKNSMETDSQKITSLLNHGEYVLHEVEALYKLKKYRTLKRRYYDN